MCLLLVLVLRDLSVILGMLICLLSYVLNFLGGATLLFIFGLQFVPLIFIYFSTLTQAEACCETCPCVRHVSVLSTIERVSGTFNNLLLHLNELIKARVVLLLGLVNYTLIRIEGQMNEGLKALE